MSHLKSSLFGAPSYVLWKKYHEYTFPNDLSVWYCCLRFVVHDWSTVVVGKGAHKYLAGSRAMQAYMDFCKSYGMVPTEDNTEAPVIQLDDELLAFYNEVDERWFNILHT